MQKASRESESHGSDFNETLISVIIPTFTHVNLLQRSVSSALSQTHRNVEVIIVDDGSPEDVKDVLSNFDDSRLIYLGRLVNQGVAAARNWGIRNARGRYIAFLDSDDDWKNSKLEAQLSRLYLKGPSYKACYTRREKVDDTTGRMIDLSTYDKEDILSDTLYRSRILMSSLLVEKDLLLDVKGFDERIRIGEDWELYIRLAQRTFFAYVEKPLTRYHFHDGQVTRTFDGNKTYVESLRIILDEHEDLYRKDRRAWGSLLYQLGYYQMTCGMKKEAKNSFLSSIRHYPIQKNAYLSLARMVKGWD
jgi:glycosyltransferase involved in cell wall biosynthesis